MSRCEFSKPTKRAALERSQMRCEAVGTMRSKGKSLKWIEALLANVPDRTECIAWPFSKRANGYGQVFIAGRRTSSNNLICEMAHGAAPDKGMHAAHSCGNNWCCNPHHISWKTPKQNMEDKIAHGTQLRGAEAYNAKINETDAIRIRERAWGGETLRAIGLDYGLTPQTVWDVKHKRSWRHV